MTAGKRTGQLVGNGNMGRLDDALIGLRFPRPPARAQTRRLSHTRRLARTDARRQEKAREEHDQAFTRRQPRRERSCASCVPPPQAAERTIAHSSSPSLTLA
jgi:hypothetical protein